MRKLSLLIIGLSLALYGQFLMAGADSFAPYVLRDGLLLSALGALLFAANTWPVSSLDPPAARHEWRALGRTLLGTALVCALVAGGLFAFASSQGFGGLLATVLWGMGIALLLASLWLPGEIREYAPPRYRWRVDAAGRYVRMALGGGETLAEEGAFADQQSSMRPLVLCALLLVLACAAYLRLWQLAELPPTCVGDECVLALRLADEGPPVMDGESILHQPDSPLFHFLSRLLFWFTHESLYSLRLASALLGILTLPLFYGAARSFCRAGGALLATALLAFSPWHLGMSRMASGWIVMSLLISLVLWVGTRGLQSRSRSGWIFSGMAFGLLLMEAAHVPVSIRMSLTVSVLLWLLVYTLLSLWQSVDTGGRTRLGESVFPAVAALIVGGPPALMVWRAGTLASGTEVSELVAGLGGSSWLVDFFYPLFYQGGAAGYHYFAEHPLLAPWSAALAIVGIGCLLRFVRYPHAFFATAGLLTLGVGVVLTQADAFPAPGPLLVLLPFVYLGSALALDGLVGVFAEVWRPFVVPRQALAGALAIILLFSGRNALTYSRQLNRANPVGDRNVASAIGRYLAACANDDPEDGCAFQLDPAASANNPLFFVPPSVLSDPAARLLVGPLLDSNWIRGLNIARDLPPVGTPPDDLIYLVPTENQQLIDLLQQLYPFGLLQMPALPFSQDATAQVTGPGAGFPTLAPPSFAIYHVPRQGLIDRQGLQGFYFAGMEFGPLEDADLVLRDGVLDFNWQESPPLRAPFSAIWEGSLLVPAAGTYPFAVEDDGDALITLQLDDTLVLDTSLGLVEKAEPLAQGVYRITLRYRTETPPGDWSVRWQLPGQDTAEAAAIPRESLFSPGLANTGLIGTYYAGDEWQGPALTRRKELILGADVELPPPYSVRWEGKVATPRAGEYLFALTADGFSQILLDGQPLLAYIPESGPTTGGEDPGGNFVQASVYLPVGWHDLEIRHAPQGSQPDLRVLWQPPGSGPTLLPGRYLLPVLAQVHPGDVPLPPPPELLDPRLGDDGFALSYVTDLYPAATTVPPTDLPPLLMEEVWRVVKGCGSGAGQLNAPHGVVITPGGVLGEEIEQGRIYVTDTGNRRVVSFALADGSLVASYPDGRFQEPVDVERAASGEELLVLDAVAQQIFRLTPAGAESGITGALRLDTSFYRPRGFALDPSGNLLVADTGGARVVMVGETGNVSAESSEGGAYQTLVQYGGLETTLGKGQPVDMLATDDALWAITAEDGRLWRLETQGSVGVIPRSNTLDGPHLAGLPDGSFFLSDPTRRTVLYHGADGEPLRQFAFADVFTAPTGVAASQIDDLVYLAVADSQACSLSLWRAHIGTILLAFGG